MANKQVKIVVLQPGLDYHKTLQNYIRSQGIICDIVEIPTFLIVHCNKTKINQVKQALRKEKHELIVFIPGTTELFLTEPDLTIMFAGYRSWCNPNSLKVIPHIWFPNSGSENKAELIWQEKPPLSVGFMGKSYENSHLAKLASYLPKNIKNLLIDCRYLKHLELTLWGNMVYPFSFIPCVARIDAIKQLESANLPQEVIRRDAFYATNVELIDYQQHLIKNTYILCPRGVENYSFRFYETLAHGRIPVLIDTNMILPPGINWDGISLRIPYHQLHRLEEIIRNDYETKTAQNFFDRQSQALQTMQQLKTGDWLQDLGQEIAQLAK